MKIRTMLLLCACLTVATALASADDVPAIIASAVKGAANVWVAADAAVDGHGDLRADVVGEVATNVLRDYRANQGRQSQLHAESATSSGADDNALCGGVFFGLPAVEQYRPNNSFDDLLRESTDILAGRVLAVREGFLQSGLVSLSCIVF